MNISEAARKKIEQIKKEERLDEQSFLRITVVGNECSGLSFKIDFDSLLQTTDEIFMDKGIQIVVDVDSLKHLCGVSLDYQAGYGGKGFYFIQAKGNEKKACCGKNKNNANKNSDEDSK